MTVCPTPEERANRDALLKLRREARRWARDAGSSRDLSADDSMAAHRIERALQAYRAAAC